MNILFFISYFIAKHLTAKNTHKPKHLPKMKYVRDGSLLPVVLQHLV